MDALGGITLNEVIDCRLLHWQKAPESIVITDSPIVMLRISTHAKNAFDPILPTEFGTETVLSFRQPEKAYPPIYFTEFGILTEINPLQETNAEFAIPNVPSLMITDVL